MILIIRKLSDNTSREPPFLPQCQKFEKSTRTGVAQLMFDQYNCDHLRDSLSPGDGDPQIDGE